jgi:glycerol-3-phosphate acyltransferase PlsY
MSLDLGLLIVIIVLSYVIGSFPTAYLVARLRRVNIFEVGSGNMGATNIIRIMGIPWGIAVWFTDSAKGMLAIFLATQILPADRPIATVVAAIAVIVGHNWSVFAALITGRLRGGKGAATAFGTLLVIVPPLVIAVMLAIAGLIIALTRYVSLAVLFMFTLATVWMLVLAAQGETPLLFAIYVLAAAALIFLRFRSNIQRLLAGTERRLGERA